jgi:hypothetical protein
LEKEKVEEQIRTSTNIIPIQHTTNKTQNVMGKSKKRGGEKAHRKRVAARNQEMKGLWQKQVNLAYEKHEEWKKQNELDANKSSDDQSIPRFNIAE